MKVLVTDGDNRAALAVTRSLGRAGHHVLVAERYTPALAQVSRYCRGRVRYADPSQDSATCVADLIAAVREHGVEAIVPVADIMTMLVTEHRAAFEPHCRVPFADHATVMRAADKAALVRLAESIGVPVPRTTVVERPDAIPSLPADAFPVVLKPHRSRVRTPHGWLSCTVSYALSPDELRWGLAARRPEEFPILLQERIVGPGQGVFACFDRGEPIALFSHRRLREKPPSGGVSVLCESVPVPAQARDYAVRLLKALGWHGVAMVEFKVDSRDDTPRLMEINGRFWGSLQLAVDAGVDFPRLLLETLSGSPPAAPPAYRAGVRSRWLLGDFDATLIRLFGKEARLEGRPPSRLRALGEFLTPWQPGLHYENPRLSDPRPFVHEVADWLRSNLRGRKAEGGSRRLMDSPPETARPRHG